MRSAPPERGAARGPVIALLTAGAVSLLGSQLTVVAVPWFVLQTTGSAARTGLAGVVAVVPVALAAFFGGLLVDRLGAKRASVAADLTGGFAVALIPALYHTVGLAFWQLLALVFAGRLLSVPGAIARDSLLPDLAHLAALRLERTNAAHQALRAGAQLLGPPLAGVLIVTLGAANVLWLDALTFAASAGAIAAAIPAAGPARQPADRAGGRPLADLVAGLRFIQCDRLVLALALSGTVLNAIGAPLGAVILPVYAAWAFGSPVALGLLFAALGGGALLGTLLYAAVGHRLPRRALYLGACALLAAPLWSLPFIAQLPLAIGAIAVLGLAVGPLNPLLATVQQERIPPSLRGRVFGALHALANVATPLGILVAGYLLERVGLRAVLVGLAAGLLAVALWALANPALRDMDTPRGAGPVP